MRKLLIGVGAAVGLVVALGFAAPLLVDLNDQKPRIAGLIEEATGHRVILGGDIRFSLLPTPAISAADIRVTGPAGLDDPDAPTVASADAIDLRLSLLPLLGGDIEVAEVRLAHPTVVLDEASLAAAARAEEAVSADGEDTSGVSAGGGNVAVQRVLIENGTFEWRPAEGPPQRVEAIEANLSAPSLQGPFTLSGGASYGGMPVGLDVALGRIGGTEPVGYDLKLGLAGASFTLGGTLDLAGAKGPALAGKAKLLIEDAAALAGLTGMDVPLRGPISAEGELSADAGRVAVDDLAFAVGESTGSGRLRVALGEVPAVSLKLRMPRLDGDALAAAARGGQSPAPAPTAAPSPPPAEGGPGLVLPTGITADVDLAVDALQWSGAVVQKIALVAALEDGRLTLSRASAVLPGGTDFGLSGKASLFEGRPRFEGTIDVASDNPRALTDWFEVTPQGLPADRLTRFGLTAKLTTDGVGADLSGLTIRLDGATAKGSAGWQPGPRPTASLTLDVDRFEADPYLGAAPDLPSMTAPPASPLAEIGAAAPASPIPDLGFDIGLRLSIGSLALRGDTLKTVVFDGVLAPAALRLSTLSIGDYAGLKVGASGKLGLAKGAPEADFAFRLEAPSPKPALTLAGIETTDRMATLGRFALEGRLTGKPEAAHVDAWVAVGDTRLALAGALGALRAPQFDLKGTLSAPELVVLATQAGLTPTAAGPVLGPVDLDVVLRGTPDQPDARLDGALGVATLGAGLRATAEGRAVEMKLAADNGAGMLTRLGLAGPVSGRLALELAAMVSGDTVRVSTLDVTAGANRLGFSGAFGTGETVTFDGRLSASRLDLALFATASAGGPSGGAGRPATTGGGRWSTAPFDLERLRRIEGKLALSVDQLMWNGRNLNGVVGRIEAAAGVVRLVDFKAGAEQGIVTGALSLDASGQGLALGADWKARGLDLDMMTGRKGNEPGLSGKADLVFAVTGSGRSPFEVVSSLGGSGSLVAADGRIHGIDLKTLSDGLKTVNQPGDIIGRIAAAVKSGATNYRRIAGDFDVARGVVTLTKLGSDMDGGALSGGGTVDLPAWSTRVRLAVKLNEPADLPALGIDITGPVDDPQAEVKSRDIENYYLQKFIGVKIPGLPLPGGGSGSGSGGANPGKAIVDQIFKGLGGN
ncbi:AsmA family protein [Zavarzinia compransoris]|uniref:AsmA family protein n=1 Tax=Zavarzinia marina TaxID=2911065 RepID=UPI001F36F9F5|nr:AsmA family protein [Zavarzinia marina]MCF4164315.1 AsmA family protein [Zavarzinia marina]